MNFNLKNQVPSVSYIPGLDGIRAIAILLVLFSHSVIYDEFQHLRGIGLGAGYAGVAIFFVLSGYLITTLLLVEEEKTGGVSLRLFYIRRALRLFPAVWLYLLVVSIIKLCGGIPNHPWHSFVASLLYFRNLVGQGHETNHLWSLSIEEQFYLLWPLVFVGLARRNRTRLSLAVVMLVATTAWRIYAAHNNLASIGALYIRSDFRFDAPLFGCALALLKRAAPAVVQLLNSSSLRASTMAITGATSLALWVGLRLGERVYLGTNDTVVCVLGMLLILSQVGAQGGGSRWLAWKPLRMIGQVSYGLYLWQMLFLGPHMHGWSRLRAFPAGLFITFVIAEISYWALERPILRFKDRKFHKPIEGTPHPLTAMAQNAKD